MKKRNYGWNCKVTKEKSEKKDTVDIREKDKT